MIIPIAVILFVLGIKLIYDHHLWLSHKPVNHKLEWMLMASGSIYSVIRFANESILPLTWAYPLSALMCASFIWFFFNGLYNVIRGYNWWFTGSGGGSFTDKVLKIIGPTAQKILEIVLLFGSITFYIFYLK